MNPAGHMICKEKVTLEIRSSKELHEIEKEICQ